MGKSTHTWFLAGVSPCVTLPKRISVSVLCLKILCLIIIIIHLNQGCRGMRISGGWRFFDLPHAHATDDTKREVQGWSISNSIATHPPKENSTPRSSRVHAFPPLIGSRSSSVSVLNRGLCDCSLVCVYVCMCEWAEYLLHKQYSRLDAGEFDWLLFNAKGGWRLDAFDIYFAPFSTTMGFFLFNDRPFRRWNQNITISEWKYWEYGASMGFDG